MQGKTQWTSTSVLLGLLIVSTALLAAREAAAQSKAAQAYMLKSMHDQNRVREELRETKQELRAIREGLGIEAETTQSSATEFTPPSRESLSVVIAGIGLVLLAIAGIFGFRAYLMLTVVQLLLAISCAHDFGKPEAQYVAAVYAVILCLILPISGAIADGGQNVTVASLFSGRCVRTSWLTVFGTVVLAIAWNAINGDPQSPYTQVWYYAAGLLTAIIGIAVTLGVAITMLALQGIGRKRVRTQSASAIIQHGDEPWPKSEIQFWARRGNRVRGPISRTDMLMFIRSGKVTGTDLCSQSAQGPWIPISRVFAK